MLAHKEMAYSNESLFGEGDKHFAIEANLTVWLNLLRGLDLDIFVMEIVIHNADITKDLLHLYNNFGGKKCPSSA